MDFVSRYTWDGMVWHGMAFIWMEIHWNTYALACSYSCGRLSNRFSFISMCFHFMYTKTTLRVHSLSNKLRCRMKLCAFFSSLPIIIFSVHIIFIYRFVSDGLALIMNNACYCSIRKLFWKLFSLLLSLLLEKLAEQFKRSLAWVNFTLLTTKNWFWESLKDNFSSAVFLIGLLWMCLFFLHKHTHTKLSYNGTSEIPSECIWKCKVSDNL